MVKYYRAIEQIMQQTAQTYKIIAVNGGDVPKIVVTSLVNSRMFYVEQTKTLTDPPNIELMYEKLLEKLRQEKVQYAEISQSVRPIRETDLEADYIQAIEVFPAKDK